MKCLVIPLYIWLWCVVWGGVIEAPGSILHWGTCGSSLSGEFSSTVLRISSMVSHRARIRTVCVWISSTVLGFREDIENFSVLHLHMAPVDGQECHFCAWVYTVSGWNLATLLWLCKWWCCWVATWWVLHAFFHGTRIQWNEVSNL